MVRSSASVPPGPHPEREVLAALALDDRLAGAGRAHLDRCARCAAEVADLRAAVARSGAHRAVPPHLWARVEDQLRRHTQVGPDEGPPTPRRRPTRQRSWAAAGLAVAALLGTTVWTGIAGDGRTLASVDLAPLEEGGSGTAVLTERDGAVQLRIEHEGVHPGGGYLELWLRDASGERLVSLGPAVEAAPHPVPPGLDPADYPVVELSVEALDGDPGHGGRSVLRGTLGV